jgi:two-component system sensor histidine kinase QseC
MRAGSMEAPVFFEITLTDGRAFRCAGVRITPPYEDETPSPPQVDAVLAVGLDRATLARRLTAISTSLLLVGGGALAALGAIVFWGVRAGLAPLDRLGANVAAVDAQSLATRFPVEGLPSELRPIVVRLNELLARLESAFARERRFTATAAHELRTPLAELRALAEVSLSTPASANESQQSWRDALATTLRMESLALRLLDLARAEDSAFVLQRTTVSLTRAFSEAWQPWAERAVERGLAPHVALTPGLTAQTDPTLLAVILGNLCENVVQHAPAGTPIHVRGNRRTDGVHLLIQNQAGELTEADMPHLFERFWRKDETRSDGQHHGLGLALAAEFVALLGGTLSATLGANGDLEFNLWLPV